MKKNRSLLTIPYEEYKKRALRSLIKLNGMFKIDVNNPRVKRTGDLLWIDTKERNNE